MRMVSENSYGVAVGTTPPKIIVQAGGPGTRMGKLTREKPKALVPVKGLPILFHLFRHFKGAEFAVVGDYKYEVLERYLRTFAWDVRYRLVHASGRGNVAGLRDALRFAADDEPVLLVWCDIILPKDFTPRFDVPGCQVGTVTFPCSWSLTDGKLDKVPGTEGHGVAGLFVVDAARRLRDLPQEGSFTRWLQGRTDIPLTPLPLEGCIDVGTEDAYKCVETTENRCRPYNCVVFSEDRVIKTPRTPEAELLIQREILWYKWMERHNFSAMPKMYATEPLTLERIRGNSVFLSDLDARQKEETLDRIIDAVREMHSLDSAPAREEDLLEEYYRKTIKRIEGIAGALPFAERETIRVNGKVCANLLRHPELLEETVRQELLGIDTYCPIHGDCQLTNTLRDERGNIYFIDARGYFGSSQILGDPRYDWTKIYYAVCGNFDQFNVKNFTWEQTEEGVNFRIASGGWEGLTEHFLSRIPAREANLTQIRLIHAIVWLSLASHAWEDYDSLCVAFFNGLQLFHDRKEGIVP